MRYSELDKNCAFFAKKEPVFIEDFFENRFLIFFNNAGVSL